MGPIWFRLLDITSLPWRMSTYRRKSGLEVSTSPWCWSNVVFLLHEGGTTGTGNVGDVVQWLSAARYTCGRWEMLGLALPTLWASALFGLAQEVIGMKSHTLELCWGSHAPQLLPAPICDPKAVGSSQREPYQLASLCLHSQNLCVRSTPAEFILCIGKAILWNCLKCTSKQD